MVTTQHLTNAAPPSTPPRKGAKATQGSSLQTSDPSAGTLLLVQPEVLARMAIAEYLRGCGYKVIEASNGEEALKVLESAAKVDVVLAEIGHLKDGEGFAFARRIHQTYPSVDVLLTSSVAGSAEKAADLCDEGVLRKPYHPDELLRRIHVLRERRRSSSKLP